MAGQGQRLACGVVGRTPVGSWGWLRSSRREVDGFKVTFPSTVAPVLRPVPHQQAEPTDTVLHRTAEADGTCGRSQSRAARSLAELGQADPPASGGTLTLPVQGA